jgi:hypothetical protein
MGPPVTIILRGRKVFLCCKGCKDEALEHPDQTLAEAQKRQGKGAAPAPAHR